MERLRYVALGDSYTIGTSVAEAERWPNLLVKRLRERSDEGATLELIANLGVNGYTSADVIEDELPRFVHLAPRFASLLVGVNDVVQGVPETTYRSNVGYILDTMVAAVGARAAVIVSTPDYTLTPRGGTFGEPATQRARIARLNDVMSQMCADRGISFVSISAAAERVAADRSLVARDGLHPSGAQYARWVDLITPAVVEMLRPRNP